MPVTAAEAGSGAGIPPGWLKFRGRRAEGRGNHALDEHSRGKDAMEAANGLFALFMKHLPGAAFIKDRHGIYRYVNETLLRSFGGKVSDWIGKSDRQRWPAEAVEQFRATDEQVLSTLETVHYLAAIQQEDGVHYWLAHKFPILGQDPREALIGGVAIDITERIEAEEALKRAHDNLEARVQERTARLRQLTAQLLTAQEQERKRVARDLHDDLGQNLLLLKLRMSGIKDRLGPFGGELETGCREMIAHVSRVIEDVRRISRSLSPSILEDLGLTSALRHLLDDFCKHHGVKCCSFEVDDIDALFSSETQIHLYRIIQEGLTNVGKHASASHVSLLARREGDRIALVLADNGKGFDVKGGSERGGCRGLGLATMSERARLASGTLEVASNVGGGTKVQICVPIERSGVE